MIFRSPVFWIWRFSLRCLICVFAFGVYVVFKKLLQAPLGYDLKETRVLERNFLFLWCPSARALNARALECWSAGALESSSARALERWSARARERWSAGALKCSSARALERSRGRAPCERLGARAFECSGAGALERWSARMVPPPQGPGQATANKRCQTAPKIRVDGVDAPMR